jgi:serine/threonine protein kinase
VTSSRVTELPTNETADGAEFAPLREAMLDSETENCERLILLSSASSASSVGENLDGHYRIEGARFADEAILLAVTHVRLGRRVTFTVRHGESASDALLVERLRDYGQACGALQSEHVARVLGVGLAAGRPCLVTERLDGQDLATLLADSNPVPIPIAVDFLLQACEAIAAAHAAGIVHGNLKPANLFLTCRADGSAFVKVFGFGLSRMVNLSGGPAGPSNAPNGGTPTSLSKGLGSAQYMSPEQTGSPRCADGDERSDIWALGAIVYELIAQRPAFDGKSVVAVREGILSGSPASLREVRPDIAPAIEAVILRCLEKDPSRRYATVAELARALVPFGLHDAYATGERIARVVEGGIEGRGAPWTAPLLKATKPVVRLAPAPGGTSRRRVAFGYALGALGLLILAAAGWIAMGARSEKLARSSSAAPHPSASAASAAELAPKPTSTLETTSAKVPVAIGPSVAAPAAPAPEKTVAAAPPPGAPTLRSEPSGHVPANRSLVDSPPH